MERSKGVRVVGQGLVRCRSLESWFSEPECIRTQGGEEGDTELAPSWRPQKVTRLEKSVEGTPTLVLDRGAEHRAKRLGDATICLDGSEKVG